MSGSVAAAEQKPAPVGAREQHDEATQTNSEDLQGPSSSSEPTFLLPSATAREEAEVPEAEIAEEEEEKDEGSYYWDASTMAPLNAVSAAAIARLRAYKPPPFPLWDRLPLSRRAAVLMLLYADRRGDLRVVITMRAATLRNFSGHAALPGGKADSLDETPYQIARREAWEEIGLPLDDTKLPPPFRIEPLCYLPMSLARTELVVRPCVALLHTADPPIPTAALNHSSSPSSSSPTAEESLIPRLDAREVAAVFSAPFHNFLRATDEEPAAAAAGSTSLPSGKWYEGQWTTWHDQPWRMHFFYVPVAGQRVAKPRPRRRSGLSALSEHGHESSSESEGAVAKKEDEKKKEEEEDALAGGRYKVWGMTARILVDAATIAYGELPEFEHNRPAGDEGLIGALDRMGRLGEKKKPGSVVTPEDMKRARDMAEREAEERKKEKGEGSKI